MSELLITTMQNEDWPQVQGIYREGIETGNATFETQVPEWEVWDGKTRPQPRLVARLDGQVVGWAALSSVSARAVYAGVCEVSVYVAPASWVYSNPPKQYSNQYLSCYPTVPSCRYIRSR